MGKLIRYSASSIARNAAPMTMAANCVSVRSGAMARNRFHRGWLSAPRVTLTTWGLYTLTL